ncbi:hypothetical protein H2248_012426 [Termitomyces sp. 'cryptogamus']|nr:hypothetical protein H2248_012426 [Termitomyces sp. 'cryptogamus']
MASEPPKPAESPFPPTFTGYPPPPQGAYPYLPFPAAQEASDGAGTGQAAYMMLHPVYYANPQTQPYNAAASAQAQALRPKRKQVKMACTNCANACKRCDESRPCERCIKYNTPDTCVDGQRKERKKGIKRGPYKRKNKLPAEQIPDPAAPDAEWLPGPAPPPAPPPGYVSPDAHPPLGFYPMYYPPPGFIHPPPTEDAHQAHGAAPPPPHGLPYFLPPYGHPFPYPGLFHPPPPAPVPNEQGKTNATAAPAPAAAEGTPAVGVVPAAVTAPVEKKKRKSTEGKAPKKAKRVKEAEAGPTPTPIEAPVAGEQPKETEGEHAE